jgi:EAL domain-containing protein (putative c-di-GMP-specific phosphodiesterase class I)
LATAAFEASAAIEHHLMVSSQQQAANEAELVATLGFAAAASDGTLSREDVRAARAQTTAARSALDISRISVWLTSGELVFSDPAVEQGRDPRTPPPLVRRALSISPSHRLIGPGGSGGRPEVVVPVTGSELSLVVDFTFEQTPMESTVMDIRRRVDLLVGVGAVVTYFALLPLLVWLVRRLPTRQERRRQAAIGEFTKAVDRGELCLWYQPKLAIGTGEVVGVEALVRWQHPTRGLLGPGAFIEFAESGHLLARLNTMVLEDAGAACARWQRSGVHLPIAVNISASSLLSHELVGHVTTALTGAGLDPSMLTIEITETAVMHANEQASTMLTRLRDLGVSISMDDFGSGYSSLRRISSLPLDELKIDRAFVSTMASDERVLIIIKVIVDLGRALNLRVIAEGVELPEELSQLAALGCDAVQGFLFAKPMPEAELLCWLDQRLTRA